MTISAVFYFITFQAGLDLQRSEYDSITVEIGTQISQIYMILL